MKKMSPLRILQYLTLGYGVLYLLFILSGDFGGAFPSLNAEGMFVYSLFLLFLAGVLLSFSHPLLTGLTFFTWNVLMWVLELFIAEGPGGFGIISGIPLFVLGLFFILNSLEKRRGVPLKTAEKWILSIKILSILFSLLYLIVVIEQLSGKGHFEVLSLHGVYLLMLIAIYGIGLYFVWKKELIAGIIFIFWYAGVVYIFATDPAVASGGPWAIAGLTILILGLMLLTYHKRYLGNQNLPDN
ncbi:MAG: hypothetical protein ACOYXB_05185 [Bacteroidota bacterium]